MPRIRRLARITRSIAFGLGVAACDNAVAPIVAPAFEFSGRLASKPWTGDASAALIPGGAAGDTLYLFGSAPVGGRFADETFTIRVVFHGPGTYPIAGNKLQLLQLVGGDGITGIYSGRGSNAGVLRIDSHSSMTDVIEGTASFDVEHTSGFAPYGPVTSFTEGSFRAVIRRVPPRS